MAELIVGNLDDDVVSALELRAVRNARSAEEEHRAILRSALFPGRPGRGFNELLASMPDIGDDDLFERAPDRGRDLAR